MHDNLAALKQIIHLDAIVAITRPRDKMPLPERLPSEYWTGKVHAGRIDTLGLDENNCPTIVEYKRNSNVNVISQGLFYLDWLLDHKAEFELPVQRKFGQELADQVDWSGPRLLCIAEDFTRYDAHAIQQIHRNIELLRYQMYGDELLLLELVNFVTAKAEGKSKLSDGEESAPHPTLTDHLATEDPKLDEVCESLRDYLLELGDDVQEKFLKHYIAYKRLKNFACVHVQPGKLRLQVYLQIDPDTVQLEDGFSQDKRNVGHYGTGDLELLISSLEDLEKAKPLIERSFEEN